MSLPGMLSAMREILLDLPEIPASEDTRRQLYRRRFSDLSDEEVEDLARIPAEKFGIYKQTIFRKEGSVLRIHFKASFSIVQRHWKEVTGERKFSRAHLTQLIHKTRPWNDNTTEGLAENFRRYLLEDNTAFLERAPVLRDLLNIEYANMMIKRLPGPAADWSTLLQPQDLVRLTVAELLELQLVVSPAIQSERFSYDVIQALADFFANDLKLPREIPLSPALAVGGRNRENLPRWVRVGPSVFNLLAASPRNELQPLSLLAEAVSDDEAEERTDAEIFQTFLALLVDLMKNGAVVIPAPRAGA